MDFQKALLTAIDFHDLPSGLIHLSLVMKLVLFNDMVFLATSLFAAVLLFLAFQWSTRNSRRYPPGPPFKNVIAGNLRDLPPLNVFRVFTEWAKAYGGLVHLRVFHKRILVVNTLDVANDLFEKRSATYSDRPDIPMVKMMGWDYNTSMRTADETWKQHRRIYQHELRPDMVRNYKDVLLQKTNVLLYKLLTEPNEFLEHTKLFAGSVSVAVGYGHNVASRDDHHVRVASAANDGLAIALRQDSFLVNHISILRYIPEWCPGGGFHRFAREVKGHVDRLLNEPLDIVRDLLNDGKARPCVAVELLKSAQSEQEVNLIREVCAGIYAGGTDSSASVLETFLYAMARFGHVQRKAQAEIENVIGHEQLPFLENRSQLPYVEALYREVLRWRPPFPVGAPRVASAEDDYNGFRIPKDATVLPNVWAMSHDPMRYNDPENFDPSRFLDDDGKVNDDTTQYVFGFGRRICPGRHLASATLWLAFARILAAFNIQSKKDMTNENLLSIDDDFDGSFQLRPLPFEASITPRPEAAKALWIDAVSQCENGLKK